MRTGGMKVVTAAQMRAMDSFTIDKIGIPGVVLMENAGRAVVDAIEDFFESDEPLVAAVFCGKGNNGGDGFVVARHMISRGHDAVVFLLAKINDLSGDALTNARIAQEIGIEIREVPDRQSLSDLLYDSRDYHFIIDAIFGTGLTSAVKGHYLGAIDLINSSSLPVVAVDIPSGLSSDSGELLGPAVEADLTVTFAYPKIGLVMPPSSNYAGEVVVADISIPESAESDDLDTTLVTDEFILPLLLDRDPDSHKGTYGHVLGIAGSRGKTGAAAMVGKSALLAGAGLVTMGVAESLTDTVDSMALETMTLPLPENVGHLSDKAFEAIIESLSDKTSLAIGPGIGVSEETVKLVHRIVEEVTIPMVLDADAVNAFAGEAGKLRSESTELVITPHPGELARLLEISTTEVQKDRIGIARKVAVENGIVVVLKGYRTVVADPSGEVFINLSGNAGMATAGSGDVLTGMIAAMLGRGDLATIEAVVLAVYLHGLAGDIAAVAVGQDSLNASHIMNHISLAFGSFEEEEED